MNDRILSLRLNNSSKRPLNLYIEPWGEIYVLDPDKKVRIDASGPVGQAPDNMLEIESNDQSITVWGWSGSSVTVHDL